MRVQFNTRVAGQPNLPLTVRMRSAIAGFPAAVRKAEEESGRAFVQRAKALSQGWISEDALRQLGHPYRIGGDPPIDPAIINRHSGNFAGRWQFRVSPQNGEMQLTVFNTAQYAKYFGGTNRMIPRPILQAVYRLEQSARIERLRYARDSVLNKIRG